MKDLYPVLLQKEISQKYIDFCEKHDKENDGMISPRYLESFLNDYVP